MSPHIEVYPRVKTILHIGQHKTGTTSLQYTLAKNRRELSSLKILYPRLQQWSFAHHSLVPYFIGAERSDPYLLRKLGPGETLAISRSAHAWEKVKQQVDKTRPEILVLSSEALFHASSEQHMERLGSSLREISDQIDLVIYLRDPASHALATLSNQIQVHANFIWPGNMLRKNVIESYQRMKPDRIHVIQYSDQVLYNADVIDDFAHRLLPDRVRLKKVKKRANPTLSAEAMSVMQQYVLCQQSNDQSRMSLQQQVFRKVLTRVDQLVAGYSKPRFVSDKRETYLNSCLDLGWLKDQYNIDWRGDDPGHPTINQSVGSGPDQKISALCVFDSKRERQIRGIMRICSPKLSKI